MEPLPLAPMDMPVTYRICVTGDLKSSWAERYWGMTATPVEQTGVTEQTFLIGEVADQAALIGVINALYNSGHIVVSVERILPETDIRQDDTNES